MGSFLKFFDKYFSDQKLAETLVIEFKNQPSSPLLQVITEKRVILSEGSQWKDHKSGYQYRYDTRPENQGAINCILDEGTINGRIGTTA